ncbi:MFS transporter [Micromonospora sp. NPDC047738]|uniref:MFS transporter n=1 Tax=Micromonospora sp. NPDC047738 TaxID=3155741 RepID=UPI0033CCE1F7
MTAPTAAAWRRTRAFSLMHWAFNIGAAAAAVMAGFLAAHGYALLFAIDAVTCLIFAVIAAVGIPRVPRALVSQKRGGYRILFADRVMLVFIGLSFA